VWLLAILSAEVSNLFRSVCVVEIGLDLWTLRRELSHMPARYDTWRLVVRRGDQTRSFDFEEGTLTHVNEVWRLKTRCARWQSDSVFRLWGESFHICQGDMTLEDSLYVGGDRTWPFDFEERAPTHVSEVWRLKICCARWQSDSVFYTLRREALHMPARHDIWRLVVRKSDQTRSFDFE